ncbi:MAG TPA: hypothetical protein VNN80_20315 [Polyangiaceae bacterium]|nr:hypothetical protein [Polyangiaceae bacterium]
MSNSQRHAATPSTRVASDALAFEIAASLKEMSSTRPASGVSEKPFAAVAPSDAPRTSAETKLYEVPRELIEIARANRRSSARTEALTPIAPRPEAEQEANAQAYVASISKSPPAPREVHDTARNEPAPRDLAISAGRYPAPIDRAIATGRRPAPSVPTAAPAGDRVRPSTARNSSPGERRAAAPEAEAPPQRAWLYVSLLVALGYCAQLAWPWW